MVPEPQTQTASGSPRAASGAAVESHTRRAPPSPWCIRAHTRSRVSRAGPEPVAALQGARARHPGCPGAPALPTRPPRGRSPRPGPAGGPLPRPTLARRPPARSPSALAHLAAAGALGPRAGRPLRQEVPLAASAPGAPPGGSARLVPPGAELGGGKAGAWARRVRGAVSPPRSRGASRPRWEPLGSSHSDPAQLSGSLDFYPHEAIIGFDSRLPLGSRSRTSGGRALGSPV